MPRSSAPRGRKAAIFDIDGTIFRSSLLIEVTEALIEAGIFPQSVRRGYEKQYRTWLDRKGAYEAYVDAVVMTFARHIKGIHYRDFLRIARRVVAAHKDRTYVYTRELARTLKRQGYHLFAISKSPKGIVEQFAKSLGFDTVYGSLYETDGRGRYTGAVMHLDLLSDKAKLLDRALAKQGLSLAGSVGVGDTESDIAFLKLVARPICFNPNKKLYDAARRAGWKVVVERKDVIYELNA